MTVIGFLNLVNYYEDYYIISPFLIFLNWNYLVLTENWIPKIGCFSFQIGCLQDSRRGSIGI